MTGSLLGRFGGARRHLGRLLWSSRHSSTHVETPVNARPPEKVPPMPIQGLRLQERIERVPQRGSIIANMFMGRFDVDYLSFANLLTSEDEFNELRRLQLSITDNFASTIRRPELLSELGYDSIWKLSNTEMVAIFESIGASCTLDVDQLVAFINDDTSSTLVTKDAVHPAFTNAAVVTIARLIIQNCIIRSILNNADNPVLQLKLLEQLDVQPDLKIAYGFSERNQNLGAGFFHEWESQAELINDGKTWLLTANKTSILDDDYQYYLIFCKTFDYVPSINYPKNYDRPYGMVGLLIPKEKVTKIKVTNEHGIRYQHISIPDLEMPVEEVELLAPCDLGLKTLNFKGLGQLAVSALIAGQAKAAIQTCFDYLNKMDKSDILKQQILQSSVSDMMQRIYAMDSINYFTAAVADSHFQDQMDIHLECALAKSLATDNAFIIYNHLQSLYTSRILAMSSHTDFVKMFDAFLESSLYNHIFVGLKGIQYFGMFENDAVHRQNLKPFYPAEIFKNFVPYDFHSMKINIGIKRYLPPDFQVHGDMVEQGIAELRDMTNVSLMRWVRSIPEHQSDVMRLSTIAGHLYTMISCLSRASRSAENKTLNCDTEVYATKNICLTGNETIKRLARDLNNGADRNFDSRHRRIHARNLKYGGYFPYSPLDRVHY